MTPGVRERVWTILCEWMTREGPEASLLVTWPDRTAPSGQALRTVGRDRRSLIDRDGVLLGRHELGKEDLRVLGNHGYT